MAGRKRASDISQDNATSATASTRGKRARKEIVNDKSPLLNLPGELRNRIYKYIIADTKEYKRGKTRDKSYNTTSNARPIGLKYTSIMAAKRYKTAKQWLNAHKRRHYFGLTQTCRLFRHEFRPLYLEELSFGIKSGLGHFLVIFGHNDEIQAMGHHIINIMSDSLPHDGIDLLAVLKKMSDLKMPSLLFRYRKYSSLEPWNINDLFLTLASRMDSLIKPIVEGFDLTSITIFKDPKRHGSKQRSQPAVRMNLDNKCFSTWSQERKESHMKSLISYVGLEKIDGNHTTICCDGRSYLWYVPGMIYDDWNASEMRLLSEETD
ncbi:uncharacterized protein J4E79_008140 [Alternaria viburni]|uniref:uncharacterized protein n=1 Tax=Alternaria viburni TaxID=566460 RepID=UPI0020C4E979|nr:uncharacterized protein J4E79_008140 [Alternaria viburni]KAI4655075.1 hypothetical protein J4E79_008140 [Alternaria viburni]